MMRLAGSTVFLLLAACSPQAPTPQSDTQPPNKPAIAPSQQALPAVELAGEWRVAGIDGVPLDANYGIALSANDTRIWWEPQCAGQLREYRISGASFTALASDSGTQEVCEIGYPEELETIWSALDAADTIERTPENGVLISGNGRNLLIFSQ